MVLDAYLTIVLWLDFIFICDYLCLLAMSAFHGMLLDYRQFVTSWNVYTNIAAWS